MKINKSADLPAVSVVIPTFGRARLLERAVLSALSQTLRSLEVIVVVDGEDHDTVVIIESICDDRLRYFTNNSKLGAGLTRDRGALEASAPWIAFLDDDDEWLPGKLEAQLERVGDNRRVICMTQSKVVSPEGIRTMPDPAYDGAIPIDEWLFDRRTWVRGGGRFLQTSSLMIPRDLFSYLRFGNVRHEEWEFVFRAVKEYGYTLLTVTEPLVIYNAGNAYPIEPSLRWLESVRGLLTLRAYSGFCLTIVPHGLKSEGRNRAFRSLMTLAFRHGRPTPRQLTAFFLMWMIKDDVRRRVRQALANGWKS